MANEKRLIDTSQYKSFLKRYIKELYEVDAPMIAGAVERCLYKLEAEPTVDAVEVVHGRWIDAREYCGDYMCSNCDALYGTNKFNYCPNCGAKMDGGTT